MTRRLLRKITAEQWDEVFVLREQGWSQQRIGDKLGVTQVYVSQILLGKSPRPLTWQEYFVSKLDIPDDWAETDCCWEFKGDWVNRAGYGSVMADGKSTLAHRAMWKMYHGDFPPNGQGVFHRCDNPPCCNPSHLFTGTHADNMADSARKGRARGPADLKGERHPNALMSDATAKKVRQMLDTGEYTHPQIAKALDVSIYSVHDMSSGKAWTHI